VVFRKVQTPSLHLEERKPPPARQHWVFACAPSPTTRPPRMNKGLVVRVVGLGSFRFGCWRGLEAADRVGCAVLESGDRGKGIRQRLAWDLG
jgi:hypothetical protein